MYKMKLVWQWHNVVHFRPLKLEHLLFLVLIMKHLCTVCKLAIIHTTDRLGSYWLWLSSRTVRCVVNSGRCLGLPRHTSHTHTHTHTHTSVSLATGSTVMLAAQLNPRRPHVSQQFRDATQTRASPMSPPKTFHLDYNY